jgi:Cytidylyltransferase family
MSAIKRDHGVKDRGSMIEGYGGALDRLDSFGLPHWCFSTWCAMRCMTNADTHQFIEYRKRDSMAPSNSPLNPLNFGQVTGTVDINGYRAWLQSHGYRF